AESEFLDQVFTALESESPQVQKAASLSLRKFGLQSRSNFKKISKQLTDLTRSAKPDVSALAEEIKNELEYCL
ncbi:hypothetical protein RFZ01_08100, partial [Acinetobacter pittii]|uniref:hypothetical protein n=1 Tax=Acinetobacter pittii TaxID=48296 RepID=UPI0028138014